MLYLALSVFFSSLIFVVFKLFPFFKVQTIYAIITNYVVACCVGLFYYKGKLVISEIPDKSWFYGTLVLGLLFILVFNLMAATSQKLGVSVASVATKMSFVLPVLFGVFVYNEQFGPVKVFGTVLALAAVYFASLKNKGAALEKSAFLLPVLVFLGSGLIDTSLKFIQEKYVQEAEFSLFSAVIFACAATLGFIFILLRAIKGTLKINLKNVLGGICLGIPNYFSIYYLLKALQNDTLNSASIFTINNVAIVMFSTLLAIIVFKEKISLKNWGGIGLAIISIILVALF